MSRWRVLLSLVIILANCVVNFCIPNWLDLTADKSGFVVLYLLYCLLSGSVLGTLAYRFTRSK